MRPPSISATAVIREKCVRCHGGATPASGLDLSTPVGIFKGGKRGPAVIPFNYKESPVWQAISGTGIPMMPPFARLSEQETEAIRLWIYNGAMTVSMGDREP